MAVSLNRIKKLKGIYFCQRSVDIRWMKVIAGDLHVVEFVEFKEGAPIRDFFNEWMALVENFLIERSSVNTQPHSTNEVVDHGES